jgi:pimeloyl-ACP methyl ester carboxylesterase
MPFVRSRGATIYYEVRGSIGPPLVLLRGYASSIRTWNGVDYDLAKDHITLVMDNRGTGQSSAPAGTYRVNQMARDVVAVMQHAGFESAHVLGTSLGGMIAQELALCFSRRVRSLVLVATAPGSNRGSPITGRGMLLLGTAAVMPGRLRAQLAAKATLSPANRHKFGGATRSAASCGNRQHGSLTGLIGQAYAIFRHRAAHRLSQLSVPTLIVHGAWDELIHPQNGRDMADLIPNARLESWLEAGHDLATEDPQRLANTVRRHIQESTR